MTPKEHQEVLEWACQQGRFLGGHEFYTPMLPTRPTPKPAGLHVNGDGLSGVKRDAFLIAYHESGGVYTKVARRLKITRSTVYAMAKKYL